MQLTETSPDIDTFEGNVPNGPAPVGSHAGLLSRLGAWSADHFRSVLAAWIAVLSLFGAFAPRIEHALAGAGWQDSTSQSVKARQIVQKDFRGLGASALQVVIVDQHAPIATDPAAQAVVNEASSLLRADRRVSVVVPPQPGLSLSPDGQTAVITAGSTADPNAMVHAADALASRIHHLSRPGISASLTGDSALWADFNSVNRSAMLRSEMLSWPVTMVILVLAFGSLVAAGLPLMLTMVGLLVAAGALVLGTHLAPISIWALNFALMFALALGIDYALFLVVRFRAALERRDVQRDDQAGAVAAVAETLDTAGKAVAFSALTVLASLASILILPSPAFRGTAVGIMLAVAAVLAATLTLLPAVLAKLGTRINTGRLIRRRSNENRDRLDERLQAWGRFLWRHPVAAGLVALGLLLLAALPVLGLRVSMPSITIVPSDANARIGYHEITTAFGPGAPGTLQVLVPSDRQDVALVAMAHQPGLAATIEGPSNATWTLDQAVPNSGPSSAATGATIERLRHVLPVGSLVGGAAAENHDLQRALAAKTPLVFAVLAAVGFLLLLVALGAPLVAAAGVLITGLSIAGAFGMARLIFQDGHLSGLLGFTSQGFVDAWGPLFFGAMLFGIAMDYTLFLLSAAKERYETGADPELAVVCSMRSSGRVIISAAAVMIAVFLTFALSGPLAPKEMGVILAIAVTLDALVVRMVVLPVILRLGRRHIWYQPPWLVRVLPQVRFSHQG
ncbi:MAG TPA: MMPL family transporter [Acidimicrobiales bacterium]|nr:MMPL family transporter [Acidimicrobiales bacterium]